MICNLKLFFTISKKTPNQSPKPNTVFRALYQISNNGKDSGGF